MKTISLTALETLVYKSIQCCKMRVYVMVYSSIQNHSVNFSLLVVDSSIDIDSSRLDYSSLRTVNVKCRSLPLTV